MIAAESAGNTRAVSPKGAAGLMQIMPGTARVLGVQNPFDPESNVEAGTSYIRQLLDRYGHDLALALAAYNAGPGTVQSYKGLPPYRETDAYIRRVITLFNNEKSNQEKSSQEKPKP
jgi:soluble lytic murein transglycosylase-like protein